MNAEGYMLPGRAGRVTKIKSRNSPGKNTTSQTSARTADPYSGIEPVHIEHQYREPYP
jgi:hypothetical protein